MAKKMKKLFAMLLTVCMVMSLLGVAASAEGTDYQCGLEEHTHTEECYETTTICPKHVCEAEGCETPTVKDLICKKEPHDHTVEAGCYHKHTAQKCYPLNCSEKYDCSKQYDCTAQYDCTNTEEGHVCGEGCPTHTHGEGCAHVHGEGCPDHVHVDGCYDTTAAVICGKGEEALEGNLVCTKEVHAHVEDVAAENSCYQLHEHVADCYKTELKCNTPEHTHVAGCEYGLGVVALVGETPYTTLKAAVAAANASEAGGAVIELLDNITLSEKLTVEKTTTIDGNGYTITRATAGTLFTVNSGATLILDGGLVIDGGNNWTLNEEYYKNVLDGICGTAVDDSTNKFAISEPGAPVATDYLIKVNDSLIMYNATVQNNFGYSLIYVGANAELVTKGAVITHNAKSGGSLVAKLVDGATWTIEDGTEISYNHADGGFGVVTEMKNDCDLIINGGKIFENSSVDVNGVLVATYHKNAYIEINGGEMYHNWASYGNNNNWNSLFYLNAKAPGAKLVMNNGHIHDNYASYVAGISTNGDGVFVELNGGVIEDGISGVNYRGRDSAFGSPLDVTGNVILENARVFNHVNIAEGKTLDVETLNVNGAWYDINFTGGGTVDGNLYIYYGNTATLESGTWANGLVTVDSVEYETGLSVKSGATIDGTQVRVLDSVASGNYLNAEEAAAAQTTSYVKEEGANVVSPVLFYHRLTSAQKSNIVVTYDYNGGLDASGWSGCQITSAGAFVPTAPTPTKAGYVLAGWAYADDNDPECLTMEYGAEYAGEEIGRSLRLIALWTTEGGNTPIVTPNIPGPITPVGPNTPDVNIDEEDVPLGQLPEEEVEIGEEDVPLTELPEEDVPLAMAPATGDASAIWMALSALSGAGLFLTRKKRDEE